MRDINAMLEVLGGVRHQGTLTGSSGATKFYPGHSRKSEPQESWHP